MKKILLTALIASSFGLSAAVTKTGTGATPLGNCGSLGTGNEAVDSVTFTETGTISDVNVGVEILGDWREEMSVDLTYNSNTVVLVSGYTSASRAGDGLFTNFDSDSATACNDATQCDDPANCNFDSVGTCQPVESLTVFNAGNATTGTWDIRYCEASTGYATHELQSWSVTVDGDDQLPVELMFLEVD